MLALLAIPIAFPSQLDCRREIKLGAEVMQAIYERAPASAKITFGGKECGTGIYFPGETLEVTTIGVPFGSMALIELSSGEFGEATTSCSKRRIQKDFREQQAVLKVHAPSDGHSLLRVHMAYGRGLGNVYLTDWCTLTPAVPGYVAPPSMPLSPGLPPPPPRLRTAPLVDMSDVGAPLVSPPVLFTADGASGTSDGTARGSLHRTLVVNLTLGLVRYAGPNQLKTGMFSYSTTGVTGPTIRVVPNSTLVIHLTNAASGTDAVDVLPPAFASGTAAKAAAAAVADVSPYVTNLHLHAIHGSPNAPGDDYTVRVHPGETHTYIYKIAPDHQGGTHFYHPHLHGTTATQLGGAALGALIIEEAPGQLPAEVAGLEELPPLVMSHIDMPRLIQMARLQEMTCIDTLSKKLLQLGAPATSDEDDEDDQRSGGTTSAATEAAEAAAAAAEALVTTAAEAACRDDVWSLGPMSGAPASGILVNGQTEPTLRVQADTWYRVRLVFSSLNALLLPALPSPACDTRLIAKDGLPLRVAPRKIAHAILGPGSRADLLVRCSVGRHSLFSTAGLNGTAFGVDGDERYRAWADGPGVVEAPTILTLVAEGHAEAEGSNHETPSVGSASAALVSSYESDELRRRHLDATAEAATCPALPLFSVARPCYLADLRRTAADQSLSVGMGPGPDGTRINGRVYGAPGLTPTVRAGSVVELKLGGMEAHPFHSHVNVFQLQDTPTDETGSGGYLQEGDWHDTLIAPAASVPLAAAAGLPTGWLRVRMQADRYVGTQLLHCHNLEHSDRGQMMHTQVAGTEGDEWQGAQAVDPSCYRAGGMVAAPQIITPSCGSAAADDHCSADEPSRIRRLVACTMTRGAWRGGLLGAALLPPPGGLGLMSNMAAALVALLIVWHLSCRCSRMGMSRLSERQALLRPPLRTGWHS